MMSPHFPSGGISQQAVPLAKITSRTIESKKAQVKLTLYTPEMSQVDSPNPRVTEC